MKIENRNFEYVKQHIWVVIAIGVVLFGSVFHGFQHLFDLNRGEEVSLSILLITAILWVSEVIPLFVTSLGVLLVSLVWLLPTLNGLGVSVSKQDFFLSFFSDITLLFMGGFVLSLLLNKYRLAQRMAHAIIKKTGSKPSRMLLSIILVSAFLSMWMSNTATAAMMLAIVGPLIYQLPEDSLFSKALAIAIPFACNLGGLGTPIGTPPNAIAMQYINQIGMTLTFTKWMMICIPIMLLLLYVLWQLLLKMYPPGEATFELDETQNNKKLSTIQYLVIAVFLLTVFGWMTTSLTGLTTGTIGLMVVFVCFASGLLHVRDFRNLSWDILFMLGGGLCLGVGLNKSGLTETIASYIGIGDSFMLLLVILLVLAAIMTTFMSNTATANLLIPVAVSLGQSEIVVAVAIAIICSTAMALPVSTPPNAIAFGSGMLRAKDMVKPGLVITLVALGITLIAGYFYIPILL